MEPQGRPLTPGTLTCTSQPSSSPGVMSARCSWGGGADPGRRFRSSAFPSSLSWDSDSEKDALDEEELQHLCNPHGLAAHSPGSPSSGLRLDSEAERPRSQSPTGSAGERHGGAETEEPSGAGLGPTHSSDGAELFLSNVCQTEETSLQRKEAPERDVYTFPGDSDPESPPPAPWAHCTFIQRCKKKRVLLRPFSGLGTTRPQKGADRSGLEEGDEEPGEPGEQEVFTCVECSIYFRQQLHLQEHMAEHRQNRRPGKGGRFRCLECGWTLPSRLALTGHRRRHQESRLKILEEIQKLNETGLVSTPGKASPDPEPVGPPSSARPPAQARHVSAYRRRFICSKCNFSTRTPQALANHSKTHNRGRAAVRARACAHCAFLTSSQTRLREHHKLVHPGEADRPGSSDRQQRAAASEGGAAPEPTRVRLTGRRQRGKTLIREVDAEQEEQDEDQDTEPALKPGADATSDAASLPLHDAEAAGRQEDEGSCLRRSNRGAATSEDEEQRFLSPGDDLTDEEGLRCVERKCPYCPDRFHNGIGLANHVRGHLNRVGVSYNVRHFISPEEVNAIEKKFSYQKKKKKVANFDPDTFSVMHCEFCSAGFDTRAGLSSHARAHLRDFGITNWDVTISPIHILRELFSSRPDLVPPTAPPRSLASPQQEEGEEEEEEGETSGWTEARGG